LGARALARETQLNGCEQRFDYTKAAWGGKKDVR
jgi:hypothetical protein